MQPYFFPYLGYFRLLKNVDKFVFLDNVQFNRRGWVHRNIFSDSNGENTWVTLPLKKKKREDTTIRDLEFRADSITDLHLQFRKTSIYNEMVVSRDLSKIVFDSEIPVIEYLIRGLEYILKELHLNVDITLASNLAIDQTLRGESRIIEILKNLGAKKYINASGGTSLYNIDNFYHHGIEIKFLTEYQGPKISMLERILKEDIIQVRRDLTSSTSYQN